MQHNINNVKYVKAQTRDFKNVFSSSNTKGLRVTAQTDNTRWKIVASAENGVRDCHDVRVCYVFHA